MKLSENIVDRIGDAWTEEEDNLLIMYRLNNKTPTEIGVLLKRSEFVVNLRLHLIIYRLHREGLSAPQIRLKTNADLTQILDIIHPVNTINHSQRQYYHILFDWSVSIWNNIRNSF